MNGYVILATVENWADRWANFAGTGIQTALLGVLTVFAVLSLLWGCLEVFHYVFYTLPERNKEADGQKDEVAESPEVVQPVESVPVSGDGEVVAAIIAAITAMRAEESAESGVAPLAFRVVSFRRR